eukprot:2899586-Rhodomonas_salina.1
MAHVRRQAYRYPRPLSPATAPCPPSVPHSSNPPSVPHSSLPPYRSRRTALITPKALPLYRTHTSSRIPSTVPAMRTWTALSPSTR